MILREKRILPRTVKTFQSPNSFWTPKFYKSRSWVYPSKMYSPSNKGLFRGREPYRIDGTTPKKKKLRVDEKGDSRSRPGVERDGRSKFSHLREIYVSHSGRPEV